MTERKTIRSLSEQVERLEQQYLELAKGIGALGDLAGLETKLQGIEDHATRVATAATAVETHKQALTSVKSEAEDLRGTLQADLAESKRLLEASARADGLIQAQLGVTNAKYLARNFNEQADGLVVSIKSWWRRLWVSIGLLVCVIIGIVIAETILGGQFLSFGFALKLAIATPLAYIAYYAAKQHRLETNLKHQYRFKGAVAQSLEAYRSLLGDNIREDDTERLKGLNDFLEKHIAAVFREPMESIIRLEPDETHEALIFGVSGQATRGFKDLAKDLQKRAADSRSATRRDSAL